jgi:hypothetical protein
MYLLISVLLLYVIMLLLYIMFPPPPSSFPTQMLPVTTTVHSTPSPGKRFVSEKPSLILSWRISRLSQAAEAHLKTLWLWRFQVAGETTVPALGHAYMRKSPGAWNSV